MLKPKMIISSKTFKKLLKHAMQNMLTDDDLIIKISDRSFISFSGFEISIEGNKIPGKTTLNFKQVEQLYKVLKTIDEQPIVVTFEEKKFLLNVLI